MLDALEIKWMSRDWDGFNKRDIRNIILTMELPGKRKKGKTKEVVYECGECGHAVRLARFRRCREQMIATVDLLWQYPREGGGGSVNSQKVRVRKESHTWKCRKCFVNERKRDAHFCQVWGTSTGMNQRRWTSVNAENKGDGIKIKTLRFLACLRNLRDRTRGDEFWIMVENRDRWCLVYNWNSMIAYLEE